MSQIHFFALKDDLRPVLKAIEAEVPLRYMLTGNFEAKPSVEYSSYRELENLGVASDARGIGSKAYLVTPLSHTVNVRQLAGVAGKPRYLIDQLANPDSVTFTPAGDWQGVVVSGSVGTASDSETAKKLMKLFRGSIRKTFKKVREFWVGPEAYAMLQAGGRLTQAADSPVQFDVRET